MRQHLTLAEALRLMLRKRIVPSEHYEALRRSGAFKMHRRNVILTAEGRALLRAGDEAAA